MKLRQTVLAIAAVASATQFAMKANSSTHSLTIHEWGTFTSLQGSNGEVQDGMHHEDEPLPAFVHGRDPLHEKEPLRSRCRSPKCFEDVFSATTPVPVTQKMETPVLYFYSDHEQQVDVSVSFPNGIISQYYPGPISFDPPIGRGSTLQGGRTDFRVNLKTSPLEIPQVDPSNIYAKARNVKANYLSSEKENERFIFYRGLGNFQTTFQAKSKEGALSIANQGQNAYSAVFLVNVTATGGSIKPLGSLKGEQSIEVIEKDLSLFLGNASEAEQFLKQADLHLTTALEKSGLYPDEAQAMTDTWKASYFRTPGLRVLYILSREETDEILPITIQPIPESLVRTLVGRVEILLDTEENRLIQAIREKKTAFDAQSLGRFADPKLRRLLELVGTSEENEVINSLIERLPR